MTSSKSGARRFALAVLAAGTSLGLSACGSGMISQTANQVPAVDGGQAKAGQVSVNDVRLVVPDPATGEQSGPAALSFVASYTGYGLPESHEGVTLEHAQVAGQQVGINGAKELKRGCTLIVAVHAGSQTQAALPSAEAETGGEKSGPCAGKATASVADAGRFKVGQTVPVVLTFSGQDPIEVPAAVVVDIPEAGTYTTPATGSAEESEH